MNVFVDNTGLHAVGRCLEGRSLGKIDAYGLLQFATFLVFSEQVVISGYESAGVASRTREIRRNLRHIGLPTEAIRITSFGAAVYAKACREAATRLLEELPLVLTARAGLGSVSFCALEPDGLPRDAATYGIVHRLVTGTHSEQDLAAAMDARLTGKAVRSAAYMLATCPSLLGEIRSLAARQTWLHEDTRLVVAALRYYVNEILAKKKAQAYAPAVERARVVRRSGDLLIEALSQVIDGAVPGAGPKSLGLPSVTRAILLRAKGEPNGVIQEALRLRDKAERLREFLAENIQGFLGDDPGREVQLKSQIRDLGHVLSQELKPGGFPSLTDALQLHVGPPFVTVDVKAVRQWLRFRRLRRPVAVLTDLSAALSFPVEEELQFERLCACCSRNVTTVL